VAGEIHFADDYNWHEGYAAGGGVPGIKEFEDEWAAALHDHGLALEFKVQGHRNEPLYILYPYNWLDADRPPPIFAPPVWLMSEE
jgi:hypothetical protein